MAITLSPDAQQYSQERAIDLEGVCFEREFAYWSAPAAPRCGRRDEA